jgi:hypothetical protein
MGIMGVVTYISNYSIQDRRAEVRDPVGGGAEVNQRFKGLPGQYPQPPCYPSRRRGFFMTCQLGFGIIGAVWSACATAPTTGRTS